MSQLTDSQILITSDTIVWADGKMLGKPHDETEAFAMLRSLSGKTHQVYTAVTFAEKEALGISESRCADISEKEESQLVLMTEVDKTDVTFKELTDEEIRYYIDRYKPFDKAGAYGIQEWIGYIGCTAIHGSYFNVMGFPVHLVYQYLKKRDLI